MRLIITSCLLLLAIVSWSTAAHTQPVGESRIVFTGTPAGPQFFQLTGTCAMAAAPDIAVISGGIASAALKPIDAVAQLDKHLGIIQAYLEEAHGRLRLMQRLIELGLDRFGDNVLNSGGSRRSAVVVFRFDDFDAKLRDLEKQCVADAWKQWC